MIIMKEPLPFSAEIGRGLKMKFYEIFPFRVILYIKFKNSFLSKILFKKTMK